ncbi:hypothetical protein SDJN03_05643, partial [Cucurbita argyrosperma subsp. sororia]
MASMLPIIFTFLIFTSPSSGRAHGPSLQPDLNEKPNPYSQRIVMRKVLGMDATLMDYHEPGANPSHEPRRGSPGGRASFNP